MVEVKNIEKSETLDLFKAKNITYHETESFAMCAKDGASVLGYCLYDIREGKIIVRLIEPEKDILIADGLLRSALFVAANRGIMEAEYEETVSAELIMRLGFSNNKQNNTIDISNLFSSCENCKKDK